MKVVTMIMVMLGIVVAGATDVMPADARADEADYTRNVAIVIWDGAEILDWGGPSEVFEAASHQARDNGQPAYRVYTVSKTTEPIVSQRFITVVPEFSIEDAPRPDIIVLPGGGTNSVLKDPDFLAWCGEAAKTAEVALSVCTGAFILGKNGLLDGKEATTWYGAIDGLEKQFPDVTVQRGRRFVDNGQVVTTAGVSAGIDGALHVVARLNGKYVADRVAEYMEYRWTPESYLSREYTVLDPSRSANGREMQQAAIHTHEKNYDAAVDAYTRLLEQNPSDGACWYELSSVYNKMMRYEQSVEAGLKAAETDAFRKSGYYNAACGYSMMGKKDQAIAYLDKAIEAGFTGKWYLTNDSDLEAVREDPRFEALLAKL